VCEKSLEDSGCQCCPDESLRDVFVAGIELPQVGVRLPLLEQQFDLPPEAVEWSTSSRGKSFRDRFVQRWIRDALSPDKITSRPEKTATLFFRSSMSRSSSLALERWRYVERAMG
jgi:hypothetical protein